MDTAEIEQRKREWTGRRVEIAGSAETLRRFAGRAGTVMTVNMNGRALVQFDGGIDTGWYDLDFDDLRALAVEHEHTLVTHQPGQPAPPTPAEPPPDAAPPAATASQRPSTAEILKLARRQGAAKPS